MMFSRIMYMYYRICIYGIHYSVEVWYNETLSEPGFGGSKRAFDHHSNFFNAYWYILCSLVFSLYQFWHFIFPKNVSITSITTSSTSHKMLIILISALSIVIYFFISHFIYLYLLSFILIGGQD